MDENKMKRDKVACLSDFSFLSSEKTWMSLGFLASMNERMREGNRRKIKKDVIS